MKAFPLTVISWNLTKGIKRNNSDQTVSEYNPFIKNMKAFRKFENPSSSHHYGTASQQFFPKTFCGLRISTQFGNIFHRKHPKHYTKP